MDRRSFFAAALSLLGLGGVGVPPVPKPRPRFFYANKAISPSGFITRTVFRTPICASMNLTWSEGQVFENTQLHLYENMT